MADRKRNDHYYVGNAAREYDIEVEPSRKKIRREQEREKKRSKAVVRRNQEKAKNFSKGFTLLLAGAVLATLAICVYYLSLQSSVVYQQKQVAELEKKLNVLNDENNATTERLQSLMDLDSIYKIATKKLGMVYAGEDQIVYYDGTSKDYVRQYGEIPQE